MQSITSREFLNIKQDDNYFTMCSRSMFCLYEEQLKDNLPEDTVHVYAGSAIIDVFQKKISALVGANFEFDALTVMPEHAFIGNNVGETAHVPDNVFRFGTKKFRSRIKTSYVIKHATDEKIATHVPTNVYNTRHAVMENVVTNTIDRIGEETLRVKSTADDLMLYGACCTNTEATDFDIGLHSVPVKARMSLDDFVASSMFLIMSITVIDETGLKEGEDTDNCESIDKHILVIVHRDGVFTTIKDLMLSLLITETTLHYSSMPLFDDAGDTLVTVMDHVNVDLIQDSISYTSHRLQGLFNESQKIYGDILAHVSRLMLANLVRTKTAVYSARHPATAQKIRQIQSSIQDVTTLGQEVLSSGDNVDIVLGVLWAGLSFQGQFVLCDPTGSYFYALIRRKETGLLVSGVATYPLSFDLESISSCILRYITKVAEIMKKAQRHYTPLIFNTAAVDFMGERSLHMLIDFSRNYEVDELEFPVLWLDVHNVDNKRINTPFTTSLQ